MNKINRCLKCGRPIYRLARRGTIDWDKNKYCLEGCESPYKYSAASAGYQNNQVHVYQELLKSWEEREKTLTHNYKNQYAKRLAS